MKEGTAGTERGGKAGGTSTWEALVGLPRYTGYGTSTYTFPPGFTLCPSHVLILFSRSHPNPTTRPTHRPDRQRVDSPSTGSCGSSLLRVLDGTRLQARRRGDNSQLELAIETAVPSQSFFGSGESLFVEKEVAIRL